MAGCDAAGSDEEDGADTTAPSVPSSLSGESTDSMIELAWDAVDTEDVEGDNVYRGTTKKVDASGTPLVEGRAETSSVDEGVDNGTTYYYVVTAVDAAGNESNPSAVLEKTPFPGPPDQPEG